MASFIRVGRHHINLDTITYVVQPAGMNTYVWIGFEGTTESLELSGNNAVSFLGHLESIGVDRTGQMWVEAEYCWRSIPDVSTGTEGSG